MGCTGALGKTAGEGIGFVCVEDARYPQKLRRISATPYALYYIGRLPDETRKSVAIVGARTRSAYGSQITGKLARALAQNRMDIISGMAMGIDADAHSGALEENGDTYAVLGCGVDVCYPKRNRYLYEKCRIGEVFCRNIRRAHRRFRDIFRKETVS